VGVLPFDGEIKMYI